MLSVKAGEAVMKGYALVRDKNGNPKVDHPENIPTEVWDQLSEKDKEFIYGSYTLHGGKEYTG